MRRLSLRLRLLLITLALLVIGLGTGSAIVTSQLERHLENRMDSELRSVGQLLLLSPGPISPSSEVDSQRLAVGLDLFGSPYFVFLDRQGNQVTEVHSPVLRRTSSRGWRIFGRPSRVVRWCRSRRATAPAAGARSPFSVPSWTGRWWLRARSPKRTALSPGSG